MFYLRRQGILKKLRMLIIVCILIVFQGHAAIIFYTYILLHLFTFPLKQIVYWFCCGIFFIPYGSYTGSRFLVPWLEYSVEDILHVLIVFCVESLELDFALLYPERHALLRVLPVLVVLATSSEKDSESLYKRVKINRLINIFKVCLMIVYFILVNKICFSYILSY